jgi:hypothetical protein
MGRPKKQSHGTVFLRSNGRYTAQISDDGGRRSIGTFPSRKAAETARHHFAILTAQCCGR